MGNENFFKSQIDLPPPERAKLTPSLPFQSPGKVLSMIADEILVVAPNYFSNHDGLQGTDFKAIDSPSLRFTQRVLKVAPVLENADIDYEKEREYLKAGLGVDEISFVLNPATDFRTDFYGIVPTDRFLRRIPAPLRHNSLDAILLGLYCAGGTSYFLRNPQEHTPYTNIFELLVPQVSNRVELTLLNPNFADMLTKAIEDAMIMHLGTIGGNYSW